MPDLKDMLEDGTRDRIRYRSTVNTLANQITAAPTPDETTDDWHDTATFLRNLADELDRRADAADAQAKAGERA